MKQLDYRELGAAIKRVYIESDKYQLNKHVPTFELNGRYVGDFFNFTMFEPKGDLPPIFYHVFSPYDIISGRSSQYAIAFRSGELILSTDFTPYMQQRTGVMAALVLQGLGMDELSSKKVLYVGTGTMAQRDLAALKAHFADLQQVSYVSRSGKAEEFLQIARELGVDASQAGLDEIGTFDVVICHTNSKIPVLTADMKSKLKPGALITTASSEDFTEVASDLFDTKNATILIDWDQTIEEAPELKAAVEAGTAKREQIMTLKQLFSGEAIHNKPYVIYRTHGTPMQNLAAMQLLMS